MHPDHSYVQAIDGNPKTIYRPGEYEIGGVLIIGLPAYHDDEKGIVHGKNSVFAIEIDDISIVHLGDLGHPLSASQIEQLGNVDVLLIPVGGGSTISASQAAALVRSMDAKIVIPMHYKTLTLTKELDSVDKFLKEMGITESVPFRKILRSSS
jgi:L-ascorbate metabolism protein UlaG (beta-lactamase superfamily)